MEIGVKPGQLGWRFSDLVEAWRAAEGSGFDLLSCFDHVSDSGAGPAWDAPTLLVAMAGETEKIVLAVHVLNAALRNPLLLAGQIAVAQAAADGRVEVGLGTGSGFAQQDHAVSGVEFPVFADRVNRLEAICRALPSLWAGETVTDGSLGLDSASLGSVEITVPRLIVGGNSDRVVEIAARFGDVWNGSGRVVAEFAAAHRRLLRACERLERQTPIIVEAQLFADPYHEAGGFPGLGQHLDKLAEAGAERVVLVLNQVKGPAAVHQLAEAVL